MVSSFAVAGTHGGWMSVTVDGSERPGYHHRGGVYIEALRGRDYTIRLTNPTAERVAIALSVDGLNSIDARHTSARGAAKWVLGPWESTEISGWQVDGSTARRFVFTGEKGSYGALIGQTDNLGIIEAVVFRERRRQAFLEQEFQGGVEAPAAAGVAQKDAAARNKLSDDLAATGMGDRTRHEVHSVHLDLEPDPIATVRLRYEFRPQLVRMGILPAGRSPIERRERASGFERYCPQP